MEYRQAGKRLFVVLFRFRKKSWLRSFKLGSLWKSGFQNKTDVAARLPSEQGRKASCLCGMLHQGELTGQRAEMLVFVG